MLGLVKQMIGNNVSQFGCCLLRISEFWNLERVCGEMFALGNTFPKRTLMSATEYFSYTLLRSGFIVRKNILA